MLKWTIIADKDVDRFEVERSINNREFINAVTITQPVQLQVQQSFTANDDITNVSNDIIYYRLKVIGKDNAVKYSNILIIRKTQTKTQVTVHPNPATTNVSVRFYAEKSGEVDVRMLDKLGQVILAQKKKVVTGYNTIQLSNLDKFSNAVYMIQLLVDDKIITQQFIILN